MKLKRLSFGGITKTPDNSWSWRNLLKLRNVAKSVVVYKLGNGKRSHIWFDPWCHGYSLVELFPEINLRGLHISKKAIVCELWRNGCWYVLTRWNPDMARVLDFLNCNVVDDDNKQDNISWGPNKRGEFILGVL